ncbi:MAG: hypothetical protein L6R42_009520 [Xanthoria sp. 1 TBL-2021]|nr:MAG: hypothetical protein L6R42_009520 [Xanthoria sp. 1 TBL-2021]
MAHDQPAFDLLGLPQEIILQIIEHEVQKEDLENLVLCSKAIFALARTALTKHQEMKWKYSTFIVGDVRLYKPGESRDVPREVHPVVALIKLLANHAVAEYCKVLKIGGVGENGQATGVFPESTLNGVDGTIELAEALTSDLEALVVTELYSQFAFVPQCTTLQLEGFNVLAWVVPFISLQNIEVLELVNGADWFLILFPIFPAMRKTHHRLKEVRLFGDHREDYADMELLCQFAKMSSVRNICGHHVCEVVVNGDEDFWSDATCPSIEEIHLELSGIGAGMFEDLLSYAKVLRVFFYEQGDNLPNNYGRRRTLEALRKYGSESLESLTFVDPRSMFVEADNDKPDRASLREFKVLKHVAIDCFFFVGEDKDDYEIVEELELGSNSEERPGNDQPRLVDILPRSLQTLELYRPRDDFRRMFDGFAELREERLPNLKSITLHKGVSVHHIIRRDLKKLGIKLAFAKGPKKRWACPSCVENPSG